MCMYNMPLCKILCPVRWSVPAQFIDTAVVYKDNEIQQKVFQNLDLCCFLVSVKQMRLKETNLFRFFFVQQVVEIRIKTWSQGFCCKNLNLETECHMWRLVGLDVETPSTVLAHLSQATASVKFGRRGTCLHRPRIKIKEAEDNYDNSRDIWLRFVHPVPLIWAEHVHIHQCSHYTSNIASVVFFSVQSTQVAWSVPYLLVFTPVA